MQLFIDTADIAEIREAASWGILDGVTTNPTHIAKTGRVFEEVLHEIFSIVDGPISVETVSLDAEGIVAEGRAIAAFHRNAVVKVPVMIEGLKAVKQLSSEGIRTNVTLCFSAQQAYLAAKAGATYISPFIHRKELAGEDGMQLIRDIRTVYDLYHYGTKILAASIRTSREVLDCLRCGADVATMPLDMLRSLYMHSMTDAGLKMFLDDWRKVPPPRLFADAHSSRAVEVAGR
ncbi:MAG TPA: fructose-6-phosphate aldolase [Bryobacteraceae bacterium]|nr:fructose-6-phosphate aldolase [Bryobacteraceae bacterium]